jgi:hypothetical protein
MGRKFKRMARKYFCALQSAPGENMSASLRPVKKLDRLLNKYDFNYSTKIKY